MTAGPMKPGLLVKQPEDASTDVGSSDEVPVAADKGRNKGNKAPKPEPPVVREPSGKPCGKPKRNALNVRFEMKEFGQTS
ncbi:unnamed protein product [Durusdinium trenchii]|uniref:Uncharacterized protein n=1 Tax=Durusdinium trenchii TaxID=1381693 RepID=A0ABP0M3Y8_9DINO